MLQLISWGQYITALLFALICYYVYVAYKYFRWEILRLIGIRKIDETGIAIPVAEIKKQFSVSNHADFLPKEPVNEINGILQPFWDEVNAYLAEIKLEAPKKEICFAVKMILEKYPALKSDENKMAVETTISGLLNQYFAGRFTATDMQHIWR
ncbi:MULTISPECIES: hypothetical protein [Hydrotalea]|uniref:hypothetical protein n=1 Tax=Hydrotalea TaxID=1004300 RepID=UPI00083225C3|nr:MULTISPECIES: hypothetical protein [Hydrotalea]RTL53375.1 MAG: hypothetical protein EKK39_06005 [Sphingobacteriales bacterium]RWZ90887.1 MAG: hypothetical protein EO766_01660 [Hydrotalea sp. AMD]